MELKKIFKMASSRAMESGHPDSIAIPVKGEALKEAYALGLVETLVCGGDIRGHYVFPGESLVTYCVGQD